MSLPFSRVKKSANNSPNILIHGLGNKKNRIPPKQPDLENENLTPLDSNENADTHNSYSQQLEEFIDALYEKRLNFHEICRSTFSTLFRLEISSY
jgi:hypothetical protein